MKLAIASGKGGTGKTTLSTALALAHEGPVRLLDCDVEEPNVHVFLPGGPGKETVVGVLTPEIDTAACTGCGICSRFCNFNALACVGEQIMTFPELCHGCGGCSKVCPEHAIAERERRIGTVTKAQHKHIEVITGRLDIGEPMAPPVIRAVKKHASARGLTIIDSPPGTSCPMITAVSDADFVLLITEPTPFGLHDLRLAVETVRLLNLRFAVVINRADNGDDSVMNYCRREGIDISLKIPNRRDVAEAYSRGGSLFTAMPEKQAELAAFLDNLDSAIGKARA